jgi:hypothetical protein
MTGFSKQGDDAAKKITEKKENRQKQQKNKPSQYTKRSNRNRPNKQPEKAPSKGAGSLSRNCRASAPGIKSTASQTLPRKAAKRTHPKSIPTKKQVQSARMESFENLQHYNRQQKIKRLTHFFYHGPLHF